MPHLLSFIRENGTLLANDHTVLISHTAGGILSTLTGVYPDRHGQTVSNSYVRTSPTGGFSFPSSFGYWTDPVSGAIPNMVTPEGVDAPAPWVPFTRAGCDVGAIAAANIAAAFGGQPIDERQARGWIEEAESLIERAERLAGHRRAERSGRSEE